MKKLILIFFFGIVSVTCLPAPVAAQAGKGFLGNWTWRSVMNKQKEQSAVWVDIKRKGQKIHGSIWFNQLVDGEADGSDASFVPFTGILRGNVLTIEYYSGDVHAIDEENVVFKRRRERPDSAVLTLKKGKLEWSQSFGSLDVGLDLPKRLILHRDN